MEKMMRFLPLLPPNLALLMQAISRPRLFLNRVISSEPPNWMAALTFFAVSVTTSFLVAQKDLKDLHLLLGVVPQAIEEGVSTALMALAVSIAWRSVGRRIPFEVVALWCIYALQIVGWLAFPFSTISDWITDQTTQAYFPGLPTTLTPGKGMQLSLDQGFMDRMMNPTTHGDLYRLLYLQITCYILSFVAIAVPTVWICSAWGSLRDSANATKARSLPALGIYFAELTIGLVIVLGVIFSLYPIHFEAHLPFQGAGHVHHDSLFGSYDIYTK